jgi:hypothetical protein
VEETLNIVISDCPCCKNCKDELQSDDKPLSCCAFPDGIPYDFMWGKINVRELEECNNGFKCEEDLS